MSVLAEGLSYGGPKLFILKQSADSFSFVSSFSRVGQVNQFTITRKSKYKIFKSLSANCQLSMFHTRVKSTSRIGPYNQDVISVIIGSLLGYGYANRRRQDGTRLCYRQSITHKDYLF